MTIECSNRTKVTILKKDDKVIVDEKEVCLEYEDGNGVHTFHNDLEEGNDVRIEFNRRWFPTEFWKIYKGPFPGKGHGRGKYPLESGKHIELRPDVEPHGETDYWPYKVTLGNDEVDPGIRIRK